MPSPNRRTRVVSIPIGFSNELQRNPDAPPTRKVPAVVSIPIGFSNELQLTLVRRFGDGMMCFNPYRVFQ